MIGAFRQPSKTEALVERFAGGLLGPERQGVGWAQPLLRQRRGCRTRLEFAGEGGVGPGGGELARQRRGVQPQAQVARPVGPFGVDGVVVDRDPSARRTGQVARHRAGEGGAEVVDRIELFDRVGHQAVHAMRPAGLGDRLARALEQAEVPGQHGLVPGPVRRRPEQRADLAAGRFDGAPGVGAAILAMSA